MSTKEFIKNQVEKFSGTENSLVILDIPSRDYTLTEIARAVESNNARVMALSTLPISGGADLLVSLKIDLDDPTAVLRSLERFNYKVVYYQTRESAITDKERQRFEELMYYLDM